MIYLKINGSGVALMLALLAASGCGKDACEDQPAEAQIDVRVAGLAAGAVDRTLVSISVNSGKELSKIFTKAEPSFVFSLDAPEYDKAPYAIRIRALARNKTGKELGYGEVLNNYSFNGCNHFTVTVKPRTASDGGVDMRPDLRVLDKGPLDLPRTDSAPVDMRLPDKAFTPDKPQLDVQVPDAGVDMALPPDLAKPDSAALDQAVVPLDQAVVPLDQAVVPDKQAPDATALDQAPPDLIALDKALPDLPPPSDLGASVTTKWITVKAGTFQMGSPVTEPCRELTAGIKETQHTVTLTRSFLIGDQEVTQGEYMALMGTKPTYFPACGSSCPVDSVTWHMAAAYCNALSQKEGLPTCYACTGTGSSTACSTAAQFSGVAIYECKGYRLPTEAEWEYAYRAGASTAFYNGPISASSCTSGSDPNADKIGWYSGNSSNKTYATRGKQANAFGLYDMPGNVLEWTHDWFLADLGNAAITDPVGASSGTDKTIKGGASPNTALFLRAAHRGSKVSTNVSPWFGFRCVRSLPKWEKMNSGTTSDLASVWGMNDTFLFAVGQGGTILQYKGQGWKSLSSPTNQDLKGVWGGNVAGPFYAAGFGSSLLIWNGSSWKSQPVGTTVHLLAVSGVSNSTSTWVWAVGSNSKVVHYDWPTWSNFSLAGNTWLRCVFAKNTSGVWVGGDGATIHAFNGVKWTQMTTGLPGTQIFYGIYSPSSSPQVVYAVGGNDSMITKYDGPGKSWSKEMGAGTMYAIHGTSASNIFAVGPAGKILHYDGTTWSVDVSPTTEHLYGVWVAPSGVAFAVGTNGTILRRY